MRGYEPILFQCFCTCRLFVAVQETLQRSIHDVAPVIRGHAGQTILPLFSQDKMPARIDADKMPDWDTQVQDAGTEVVNAKGGKGSATLSVGCHLCCTKDFVVNSDETS